MKNLLYWFRLSTCLNHAKSRLEKRWIIYSNLANGNPESSYLKAKETEAFRAYVRADFEEWKRSQKEV